MSEPEYTLKQVIGIYEMISSRLWDHQCTCEDCNLLTVDAQNWCDEGLEMARAKRKWKRRIKRTAEREGVKMTV